MSLPSSMADFVPCDDCDRLLQKAKYLVLVGRALRDA